jgi:hypothetical protein
MMKISKDLKEMIFNGNAGKIIKTSKKGSFLHYDRMVIGANAVNFYFGSTLVAEIPLYKPVLLRGETIAIDGLDGKQKIMID